MGHQWMRDGNGNVIRCEPEFSQWFTTYLHDPALEDKNFHKKFRHRFRMKHSSFCKLLGMVKEDECFKSWTRKAGPTKPSPIGLLLLGTLRYLGRGWTFDDLEEQTSISAEVHRKFLHVFINWASTTLFHDMVTTPSLVEDPTDSFHEFEVAGMPGCIGSTDACHVGMLNCPHALRLVNNGFKLSMPTRTFNLTCNHRRQILSTTTGHPGRWNDKTLVRFDSFVNDVKNGKVLPSNTFTLLKRDSQGNVVEKKLSGVWLIVDNGYLEWSVTVPPHKHCRTYPEKRWSKWLEGMRKDVEMTFGILKCRFRVLKNGIRLSGTGNTDRIWLTCCALHNFLLNEDGMDKIWTDGWLQPQFARHSDEDLQKVYRDKEGKWIRDGHRELDTTGFGSRLPTWSKPTEEEIGSDDPQDDDDNPPEQEMAGPEGFRPVNTLSLRDFRNMLVEHFDILFSKGEVKWPKRSGLGSEPNIHGPIACRTLTESSTQH